MDRLIHTPEGVRDVYNQECTKKLYLENQIEQVFHAFGYQDIDADPPLLQRKQLRQQQQLSGPLKRVHSDGRRALKR